jgi:RNA-directed DNA polymerase
MNGQRLTEQLELVFTSTEEGASSTAVRGDAEPVVAKCEPERPAVTNPLMEAVCERENLKKALRRVKANKGSPGVDGMTVEQLPDYLRAHWPQHRDELLRGTYRPSPVRRVEIPKPDGGVRKLGVPTVLDRLVQQAVLQVLQPIFDPTFSDHSYGFRPGRSAHQAVAAAQKHLASGYRWVVDLDLEKFFDRVNHDILMSRIARRIGDKRLLLIIRRFLQAGMMQDGVCVTREEGTPQGGPLSPLLANLLLDDLDQLLDNRGHRFCRYADDCNIYVRSLTAGQRVMESVTRFLEGKLKLRVNREKSAVAPVGERKFLGHRLLLNGKLGISPTSVNRAKERIRQITSRNRGVNFAQVIVELNLFLVGWLTYYRFAAFRAELTRMDEWMRRRLRCYRLKQRKRGKSISGLLRKLGVSAASASRVGSSGKGPWRIADCPPVHRALSLRWFHSQGLVSLVAKYDSLHH